MVIEFCLPILEEYLFQKLENSELTCLIDGFKRHSDIEQLEVNECGTHGVCVIIATTVY